MTSSLVRRFVSTAVGLCAVAPALVLSACAQPESQGMSTVHFAVSASAATAADASAGPGAVRIGEVRVLAHRVNLQEPVLLGVLDGDVTLTFARRERVGATLVVNPRSLALSTAETPYDYPTHPKRGAPPFVASGAAHVRLANGGSVSCWNDDASGRVLAQAFTADGSWSGASVAVSPEAMNVVGSPHLVTADGRHLLAAFFVSTEDGFELVAASLEPAP